MQNFILWRNLNGEYERPWLLQQQSAFALLQHAIAGQTT